MGFEIVRHKSDFKRLSMLHEQALNQLLTLKRCVNIVQIGANDGRINDPIYEFVIRNKGNTKIVLVEPQTNVVPYLRENYKKHKNATVVNCAVGPNGVLKLYRLKPQYYDVFVKRYLEDTPNYRVPTGFTSSTRAHVVNGIQGNLPADISIDDAIEEIEVPCMGLKDILRSISWEEQIDLLQIDVEGMDDQVIYECSVSETKPLLINFEHNHLSDEKHKRLHEYLLSKGYLVFRYSSDDSMAINTHL